MDQLLDTSMVFEGRSRFTFFYVASIVFKIFLNT